MASLAQELPGDNLWWERLDLKYVGGRLMFAGHDVADLARQSDVPLYLYSVARVEANLARIRSALADTGCETRVYYAMKANRFAPVLESLARSGKCGVDICSPDEMDHALACGFSAAQISFTGTGVSSHDLERLLAHRELTINCDTIGMIRRIGERAPGRPIGIRINPGMGTGYDDSEMLTYAGSKTTKFGIYREQWSECLATARAYDLPVNSLHFHVGCGYLTNQLDLWDAAVGEAVRFLDDLPNLTQVNVGGGLGLPHRTGEQPLDLSRWAQILRKHFGGRGLTIAAEPGDYIVKDAGMLVLQVTDAELKRDTKFVSVNGGFNLHPEPAFYGLPCEPVPCVPRGGNTSEREIVTIAGNINEALDIWAEDVAMSPLAEGDFVAMLNAGGYGAAMSSNHCMRGQFKERAII